MEEVGVSVSEEEMIDSLFYRCDTLGEGRVHVYTVIQFLKNCLGNGNLTCMSTRDLAFFTLLISQIYDQNEPDLLELSSILESSCIDGKIDLSCYRQAVKQWVTEIRHRCESTSFLEPDGPLNSSYNLCNNSTDRSLCIETSGIGDGSFHKTEDDIGELLQELEDLKFQNRKLGEEQTQLRSQIDTQEEVTTNLTTELQNRNRNEDQLRKKIKSLQDLLELRQSVMDENEELKAKLFSTQELKRDLDTKVVSLERENVNLQSQVKNYESKWQKACSDLDLARNELQQLNSAHLQQKDLLVSLQDTKSTQEEALAERNEELAALKERLNQFMEQNEKLQEEKEDFQLRLAQMDGKLQRYQTKVEQLGFSDESLTGNQNVIEKSKISPRLRFSTPLPKNSICMELKDRLNEDKNLPSPFCEKLELSTDVNYLNRKSALLPTYMSAWDFEVSNRSLQDYSLELLKHRKSLGPEIYDSDLEKKLEGLKDLEKDGLQREIIRLYRL